MLLRVVWVCFLLFVILLWSLPLDGPSGGAIVGDGERQLLFEYPNAAAAAAAAAPLDLVNYPLSSPLSPPLPPPLEDESIYVIGDLHGDVACARQWLKKTGLISGNLTDSSSSSSWEWTDPASTLVFVGDYIDKGPQSKQVLDLVMSLSLRFPKQVVALLGNHEIEALWDRKLTSRQRRLYYHLPWSAVHPTELFNWVPAESVTDDTRKVVAVLHDTLLHKVYGENRLRSTELAPEGPNSIVNLVEPASFRPTVKRELANLQRAYVEGFASSTPLGKWLESRPITHASSDGKLLFLHGGVDPALVNGPGSVFPNGLSDLALLNEDFAANSGDDTLAAYMKSPPGRAVYDLVTYRGNHGNCASITALKRALGVSHIVVGHTPDEDVRVNCNGAFLAADSLLSRWIRTSGNFYCRGDEVELSNNGRFTCDAVGDVCNGQIVKFTKKGVANAAWKLQIVAFKGDEGKLIASPVVASNLLF